jgi:hypothetical protein
MIWFRFLLISVLALCVNAAATRNEEAPPESLLLRSGGGGGQTQRRGLWRWPCPFCAPAPLPSQQCGNTVCGKGLVCCNASCNACAPPDVACTQQVCTPVDR